MYKYLITILIWLISSIVPVLSQKIQQDSTEKRLLIVSGGGATGAWGGGVTEALYKKGYTYDAVIGSSTGSLIAPFVLSQSFEELKEGYTNITDKDIFNVRPFKTKGKNAGKLRMFNAIWRIISPKKTLGESKNLRKTIKKFFTQEDFDKLRDSDCEFYVTVVNVLKDKVEYKSMHDAGLGMTDQGVYDKVAAYNEYVNWIWASANFPVFMSLHSVKDSSGAKQYYFDGGIKESIPLEKGLEVAREKGYRHIDVIIHSSNQPQLTNIQKVNKAMKLLGRTIDIFRSEVRQNDVKLSKAMGELKLTGNVKNPIDITIYYMSPDDAKLIPNQLIFEQDKMKELWGIGTRIFEANRYNNQVSKFRIDSDEVLNSLLGEKKTKPVFRN